MGSLLTPFVLFVLVGLLDHAVGTDRDNPDAVTATRLRDDPWLRALPLAVLPICVALLLWGARAVAGQDLSAGARIGLTLSIGIVNGVLGITAAHELIHRADPRERGVGAALLALVCYGSFKIEHIRGHHVTVATPADRSSSRVGQSLYGFLPVSIIGNVIAAWRLETARLARKGRGAFGAGNEMLRLTLASAAIAAAMAWAFGAAGLAYFLGQSLAAVVLLEIVNYIQHYGLRRDRMPDGRYERTSMHHSWNSPYRLSNWFLFNLQRHSDHHARADRRFGVLRHFEESPQLPTGYGGMVLMALLPPLWSRVMDPRVAAYYGRRDEPEDL